MTGYFSKIARQSGVRLANQPSVSKERANDAAALPPRIDREEVVMLAPDPTPTNVSRGPRVETKAIAESQKAPVVEARVDEIQTPQASGRPKVAQQNADAPSSSLREPTVDRPNVAVKPPPTPESHGPAPLEVSDATVLVPLVPDPPAASAKTEEPVDHFAETIKIISGREVSKDEASSILVREIHEWIAAGPNEPEVHIEEVVPLDGARAKPENVEVINREPGVVRISGEIVTKREGGPESEGYPKPVESASIHEQTLDLSIGSINVVIEGDPAPPQHVPQHAARTAEAKTDTPRSSRLRRNYI